MDSPCMVFAALIALISSDFAADLSGGWKWTMGGRGRGGGGGGGGRTPPELTGMMSGWRGDPVAIQEASLKDAAVYLPISGQGPNGATWTSSYAGKSEEDTPTGAIEGPGRGGEVMEREWVVRRSRQALCIIPPAGVVCSSPTGGHS